MRQGASAPSLNSALRLDHGEHCALRVLAVRNEHRAGHFHGSVEHLAASTLNPLYRSIQGLDDGYG